MEARKIRARCLVRTETGKANNQTENFTTQEPQRELRSERCSYLQKEEEALTTDGVYGLESSESATSDNKHWNHERTLEHPATEHLGQDTTRGLKQETWNRRLGEVTSASIVGPLGATSSEIKEDGEQTTATRMTAGWSHPKVKRPRVPTQTIVRTKTRQPLSSQRSHQ